MDISVTCYRLTLIQVLNYFSHTLLLVPCFVPTYRPILQQECARLVDGYLRHVLSLNSGNTNDASSADNNVMKPKRFSFPRLGSRLGSIKAIKGVPDWQKPVTWMVSYTLSLCSDIRMCHTDSYSINLKHWIQIGFYQKFIRYHCVTW